MKHRLSKQATDDLLNIADYYLDYSVKTSEAVRDDIDAVFKVLEVFPRSGTVMADGTRRNVSSKYRYVIASTVENDEVVVLGIYRHQDRVPKARPPRTP